MDFGIVLVWLKDGRRVKRAAWNKDEQLVMHGRGQRRAILKRYAGGKLVTWTPESADLLATDWGVLA